MGSRRTLARPPPPGCGGRSPRFCVRVGRDGGSGSAVALRPSPIAAQEAERRWPALTCSRPRAAVRLAAIAFAGWLAHLCRMVGDVVAVTRSDSPVSTRDGGGR